MTGWSSAISKSLREIIGDEDIAYEPGTENRDTGTAGPDRVFLCHGYLRPHGAPAATSKTWLINFKKTVEICEYILGWSSHARICVIGSESGIAGSYDHEYAGSKAALHQYIETRGVGPHQQLVGIAPSIIADAGMTLRRPDQEALAQRAAAHPKGRFLMSEEVARLAYFLLYTDKGYITNTVIRMNGGSHTRRWQPPSSPDSPPAASQITPPKP